MIKILNTLLENLYFQEWSNESESNAIFTIDIIVVGDHGQEKFDLFVNLYWEVLM